MEVSQTKRINYKHVPAEKINRITKKNHQGVVAFLSPIDFHKLENVVPEIYERGKTPLIVILDNITDVRNFGAIARSAECLQVDAILVPEKTLPSINSDAVKTSAGALSKKLKYVGLGIFKKAYNFKRIWLKDSCLQRKR